MHLKNASLTVHDVECVTLFLTCGVEEACTAISKIMALLQCEQSVIILLEYFLAPIF